MTEDADKVGLGMNPSELTLSGRRKRTREGGDGGKGPLYIDMTYDLGNGYFVTALCFRHPMIIDVVSKKHVMLPGAFLISKTNRGSDYESVFISLID